MDQRPTILLVDDEAPILATLRVFLELSGFDVLTAGDGAQALEKLAARSPDLVVLDVLMP